MAATAVVKDGGLGDDISDLPAAGAALEWMSEKAIAIGHYFVAQGLHGLWDDLPDDWKRYLSPNTSSRS